MEFKYVAGPWINNPTGIIKAPGNSMEPLKS
jgi:hypothetical protein